MTTPTAPKCPLANPPRWCAVTPEDGSRRPAWLEQDANGGYVAIEDYRALFNTHATLTAEVARLREALERQKIIHAKIALAATHDGLKEFAKAAMAEVENITAALRGGA